MLTSLALIFLVGLATAAICQYMKLPRIIGMLTTGIILGPHALDFLDASILNISADLRQMALIIILITAGLSLDLSALKKVGRPAVFISFLPSLCEIAAVTLLAPVILGVTPMEAAIIGAVIAAAAPAVVTPKMVQMSETGYGNRQGIPQLLLAGTSVDVVFVVVLFTTFLSMAQGDQASVLAFAGIPISILLGIAAGALVGLGLYKFFETNYVRQHYVRNSMKTIIVLGVAFLLVALETWLQGAVPLSGLMAVVSMACVLRVKSTDFVVKRLSEKFSKLWLAAEVILFVLVGAEVDLHYTLAAGAGAIFLILIALVFRSAGVTLSLAGTKLKCKERLFCVITYLPKATVQAAIASIPLALGLPCGKLVLSVAVLSIIITAPLGAFAIDFTYKKLVEKD